MIKANSEHIEFHRNADHEIQMIEDIEIWTKDNLNNTDQKLSKLVEDQFGIPAEIVFECLQAGACQESTSESIIKAYQKIKGEN